MTFTQQLLKQLCEVLTCAAHDVPAPKEIPAGSAGNCQTQCRWCHSTL